MRILWIVNTIFPYPAEMLGKDKNVFGGWMIGLLNALKQKDDIKIAVASTYNGKELKKYIDNNIIYYLVPCKDNTKYDKKLEIYWKKIEDEFDPNLVHLHGTEYAHGLAYLRACPNKKSILSLQGLLGSIAKNYLLGISRKDVYRNMTFRDFIKNDNMIRQKESFEKRSIYEEEIIKKVDVLIGRTKWDYNETLKVVGFDKYFKCNESLRNVFYNYEWKYNEVEKNAIFVSQASYPIKGFHEMIKAISIVKNKISNVKVYIAGHNIIDDKSLKSKLKMSGYAKYLKSLIRKYNVSDNIEFIGLLSEEKVVKKMLTCNLYVQASLIENSSNSLGEAMILGMPIVASNVGGTSTMIENEKEGLLYDCQDYKQLAVNIITLLGNSTKAINLGKNARKHALLTHDREINATTMYNIYKEVLDEKK